MAAPFPQLQQASTPVDASSIKSAFLIPPLTPLDIHDVPYRPPQHGQSSLDMKKKHHDHVEAFSVSDLSVNRHHGAPERHDSPKYVSPGHDTRATKYMRHSRPLEETNPHDSGSTPSKSPTAVSKIQESDGDIGSRQRRWKLPSKSEATRGFTPLRSTVKQATLHQDAESPAIIILRRATNNPPPRKSELTFFPEPTFSHERDGLLNYLISTFSRASMCNNRTSNLFHDGRRSSRSTSVDSAAANGTVTMPAATVCTETAVDANLTMPGMMSDFFAKRRCSTKYTSGSTVYEIIWDENDSVSNADSSSRPSVGNGRRPSLAVFTLETQLARSHGSSRKQSQVSGISARRTSTKSFDMFPEQALTVGKLEAILPRLLHKTGLRDLPKSRAGRQRKSTICSITIDEADPRTLQGCGAEEHRLSVSGIEFFPPLTSRRNSGIADRGWTSDVDFEIADISTSRKKPVHKSMVGSIDYTRRQSSGYVTTAMGIFRQPFNRVTSSISSENDGYESDKQPLLG